MGRKTTRGPHRKDGYLKYQKARAEMGTKGRQHRATYGADKKAGGWLIRVEGPNAEKFAGREVPVETKSGEEHTEKLTRLIWTGPDQETGVKVALYKFEPKPREAEEEAAF
jgi:hypothetical protein